MPSNLASTTLRENGDHSLDRLMTCLNGWLERATQMEVQARQARSVLTISTLTIGAAIAATLVAAEGRWYAVVGFFLFLIAALFLNHYHDRKTTIWRRAALAIEDAQQALVLKPDHPAIEGIKALHLDRLVKEDESKTDLFVFDTQSCIFYLTAMAVLVLLGVFAIAETHDFIVPKADLSG